ncbi:DNA helicase [Pararhizobium sp. IMCC21322]|uniref:DNA helicase n=1 Tax=Pararhizobium sp. IMCC21322 TaxID=3067903 RepID=UPI0027411037|nr:DNA helicase [Pararhizobium sp. IMCC21322]
MKLSAPIYRLKREARLLSRKNKIPLHAALDKLAASEGFESWSLLARSATFRCPTQRILDDLLPGEMLLLGARPRHGKTLMALEMMVETVKGGGQCFFYSLDYTETQIMNHIAALGADPELFKGSIDTSDAISADYILQDAKAVPAGTLLVIDYLQLLDQDRSKPDVAAQLSQLQAFARTAGVIIIFISQIDRVFEASARALPDMADVRMPNPLDLDLFDKTCFVHDGEIQFDKAS